MPRTSVPLVCILEEVHSKNLDSSRLYSSVMHSKNRRSSRLYAHVILSKNFVPLVCIIEDASQELSSSRKYAGIHDSGRLLDVEAERE